MKTFSKFRSDAQELTERILPRKHGNYDSADNEHCSRCGKGTNYLMGRNECMRCYQSYAHNTPPEGPKLKRTPKTEAAHQEYGGTARMWGFIHPHKGIISGEDHPTAKNHPELAHAHKISSTHPRYVVNHEDGEHSLTIGADNSKEHIHTLLKHWDKLPHQKSTKVYLDDPQGRADGKYLTSTGNQKKVYNDLRSHLKNLQERFLTVADCMKAYTEGIKNGTIVQCPECTSPNATCLGNRGTSLDHINYECVDCGSSFERDPATNTLTTIRSGSITEDESFWKKCQKCKGDGFVLRKERQGNQWTRSQFTAKCDKCHGTGKIVRNKPEVKEDEGGAGIGNAPTNNVGSANIAGVGIQKPGDPTFAEPGVPVRRKLEIVGPNPVDPRMFADKIFGHSKLADVIHKTGVK